MFPFRLLSTYVWYNGVFIPIFVPVITIKNYKFIEVIYVLKIYYIPSLQRRHLTLDRLAEVAGGSTVVPSEITTRTDCRYYVDCRVTARHDCLVTYYYASNYKVRGPNCYIYITSCLKVSIYILVIIGCFLCSGN